MGGTVISLGTVCPTIDLVEGRVPTLDVVVEVVVEEIKTVLAPEEGRVGLRGASSGTGMMSFISGDAVTAVTGQTKVPKAAVPTVGQGRSLLESSEVAGNEVDSLAEFLDGTFLEGGAVVLLGVSFGLL